MNYAQYYASGGTGPRPTASQPAYTPLTNNQMVFGQGMAPYGNQPFSFRPQQAPQFNMRQGTPAYAMPQYGQPMYGQQVYGQQYPPYGKQWGMTSQQMGQRRRPPMYQQQLPYSPQAGWGFQQFQQFQQPQPRFTPYALDYALK